MERDDFMGDPIRVLIVEDSDYDSELLIRALKRGGYTPEYERVETAAAMNAALESQTWDLVICDYVMPDFSGHDALKLLQSKGVDLPFIIVSGIIGEDVAAESMIEGAHDYISKDRLLRLFPAIKRELREVVVRRERRQAEKALEESEIRLRQITDNMSDMISLVDARGVFQYVSPSHKNVLGYEPEFLIGKSILELSHLYHPDDVGRVFAEVDLHAIGLPVEYRFRHSDGHFLWLESVGNLLYDENCSIKGSVFSTRDITERKSTEQALQESYARLEKTLEQTVTSLSSIAEIRDPYTAGHQVRVANLAGEIASELGMSMKKMHAVKTAALIHDIGKIVIPAEILIKPRALNDLEWSFIRAHPQVGYDILKTIEFTEPIAEIVLQHHERLNGSGYPRGLTEKSILIEAMILAVADVLETMASHRPYRPAFPLEEALDEISKNRGILYSPEVVEACLRLFLEKGFSLTDNVTQEARRRA